MKKMLILIPALCLGIAGHAVWLGNGVCVSSAIVQRPRPMERATRANAFHALNIAFLVSFA